MRKQQDNEALRIDIGIGHKKVHSDPVEQISNIIYA